jgi:hypothetical protein
MKTMSVSALDARVARQLSKEPQCGARVMTRGRFSDIKGEIKIAHHTRDVTAPRGSI